MPRSEFQPGPATDHYHVTLGIDETPIEELGAAVRVSTTRLTDAQIKTLPTVAVEVVPSPGAGFAVDILRVQFVARILDDGREYTNIAATPRLDVGHDTGSGPFADVSINDGTFWGADLVSDLLGSSSNVGVGGNTVFAGPLVDVGNSDMGAQTPAEYRGDDVDDRHVTLKMVNGANGNLTGGHQDNELLVRVLYSVLPLS